MLFTRSFVLAKFLEETLAIIPPMGASQWHSAINDMARQANHLVLMMEALDGGNLLDTGS